MDLDSLTFGEVKQLMALFQGQKRECECHPLLGKNAIIRTVTMIYTGKVEKVTEGEFALTSCSWIPETERWAQFVAEGKVRECEPYPQDSMVYINRQAVLDCVEIKVALPRGQK